MREVKLSEELEMQEKTQGQLPRWEGAEFRGHPGDIPMPGFGCPGHPDENEQGIEHQPANYKRNQNPPGPVADESPHPPPLPKQMGEETRDKEEQLQPEGMAGVPEQLERHAR